MLAIATDCRRIEAEPDERAHLAAVASARRFVEVQVELARALCRVAVTKTYVAHDCVSIEEYGVRLGITGRDARQLVDLGHALDAAATPAVAAAVAEVTGSTASAEDADGAADPTPAPPVTVGDAVLAGAMSVERGAVVGRFVANPDLVREGEDPVALAMTGSVRQAKTTVRVREEELAQHEKVVPLSLAVTERARDGFRRARSLASERAGTPLTEGEAFSVVVSHFLDDFDPARRGEGPRRAPDTSDRPGQRYIPAAVKRAVRARAGDQCEFPGCPRRMFLEFVHVTAHRDGGSREESNLLLGCSGHHVLFDAGRVRLTGWTDGHPEFCDARGRRLDAPFRKADGTSTAAGDGACGGRPGPERPGGSRIDSPDVRVAGAAEPRDGDGAGQVAERPPPYGAAGARSPPEGTSAQRRTRSRAAPLPGRRRGASLPTGAGFAMGRRTPDVGGALCDGLLRRARRRRDDAEHAEDHRRTVAGAEPGDADR